MPDDRRTALAVPFPGSAKTLSFQAQASRPARAGIRPEEFTSPGGAWMAKIRGAAMPETSSGTRVPDAAHGHAGRKGRRRALGSDMRQPGQHPAGQYPTGQHSTGPNPTGQHPTGPGLRKAPDIRGAWDSGDVRDGAGPLSDGSARPILGTKLGTTGFAFEDLAEPGPRGTRAGTKTKNRVAKNRTSDAREMGWGTGR